MPQIIKERSSARVTGKLVDQDGAAVGSAQLSTLVATLYNLADSAIINGRNSQDILGANGGSVDVNGNFILDLGALDSPIVNDELPFETHMLLIEWTWNAGSRHNKAEVDLIVKNLQQVP